MEFNKYDRPEYDRPDDLDNFGDADDSNADFLDEGDDDDAAISVEQGAGTGADFAPAALLLPRVWDHFMRAIALKRTYHAARPCAVCGRQVSKQRHYVYAVGGEAIIDVDYAAELIARGKKDEGWVAIHRRCVVTHGLQAATATFGDTPVDYDTV